MSPTRVGIATTSLAPDVDVCDSTTSLAAEVDVCDSTTSQAADVDVYDSTTSQAADVDVCVSTTSLAADVDVPHLCRAVPLRLSTRSGPRLLLVRVRSSASDCASNHGH